MIEKVYTFGKNGCLAGICSEPALDPTTDSLPAVLFWNAGLLHHVGPYRLYVDMARKLAAMGFIAFRFDLSGLGDSLMIKGDVPYMERAVADIQEAMNFLSETKRKSEFILIGLCSGADNAHPVTVLDPRVSGVVSIDGFGYRTWGFYKRHFGPRRVLNPWKWKNFLKRKYYSAFGGNIERNPIYKREFPLKEKIRIDLTHLINRGTNLLYIFSSGAYNYYNYREQFNDMFKNFDFQDKLQILYFKEADHTFTLMETRQKLITSIINWLQERYLTDKE